MVEFLIGILNIVMISFRNYVELWTNIPAGETNADSPLANKVKSKYSDAPGDHSRWKKTPEQRYGFPKKCKK